MSEPRFEYKYRLTQFEYSEIRKNFLIFSQLDQFSTENSKRKYFVRSLYYDTFDYLAYSEKITGELSRIKLRVRTYFREKKLNSFVSVELKTRVGSLITKYSTKVPYDIYNYFRKSGHWETHEDSVLVEFERLLRLKSLHPNLLVDYEREAFVPKDKSDVRITFDHSIKYAKSTQLYPDVIHWHSKEPFLIILEIKTKSVFPSWLEDLIAKYELKALPNSKYAEGIEQTQHAIFY